MTRFILVDGKPVAAVHALDRGLQFGDGLFETMTVIDGQIRFMPQHLARLRKDSARLLINVAQAEVLHAELVAAAKRLDNGVIKLIVTRGSSSRGYSLPAQPLARRILIASDRPKLPDQIRLMVCRTRLAAGGSLVGIKHLNRLEQVMACAEWQNINNVDEGLMLDPDDNIIEATSANVFIVRNDRVCTPVLDRCGVNGIMRDQVMKLLRQSDKFFQTENIGIADIKQADEIFLTNSVGGVRPVVSLGDKSWEVGPVCTWLRAALEQSATVKTGRQSD